MSKMLLLTSRSETGFQSGDTSLKDVLNSDRKNISLTDRVSYVSGKQDEHLWLKVNKKRQKCHVNWVVGMLEESVTTIIAWSSGKLYNHWRCSTLGKNREQRSL